MVAVGVVLGDAVFNGCFLLLLLLLCERALIGLNPVLVFGKV